nr:uncharacterized protein LOC108408528 isoform X2 [Manis javanica]
MVQGKTCQRAILPRPLCLGMRLSRVCRHHRLLREPTSHETPWLDLVYPFGVGVFTRLLFFSFDYFFPFTCIWLISLPAPGNKGTASSQPRRGISAPCPDSCIALLVIIFDARPPEPPELLPELGPISRRHSRFIYTSQSGREKANRASKTQAWPEGEKWQEGVSKEMHGAKELTRPTPIQAHFWARNTSAHSDSPYEAPATARLRCAP